MALPHYNVCLYYIYQKIWNELFFVFIGPLTLFYQSFESMRRAFSLFAHSPLELKVERSNIFFEAIFTCHCRQFGFKNKENESMGPFTIAWEF